MTRVNDSATTRSSATSRAVQAGHLVMIPWHGIVGQRQLWPGSACGRREGCVGHVYGLLDSSMMFFSKRVHPFGLNLLNFVAAWRRLGLRSTTWFRRSTTPPTESFPTPCRSSSNSYGVAVCWFSPSTNLPLTATLASQLVHLLEEVGYV